jgi:hypothetical protein
MKTTVPLSLAGLVGAWLLLALGLGCDRASNGGGAGGTPGSPSSNPGLGGSGATAPGSSFTGGVSGSPASGGATGNGGNPVIGDAATAGVRDAQPHPDVSVRPGAADAPPLEPDVMAVTSGDSACVPDYSCQPVSPNTGDPYADCVARVNQFRACVCLPPLAQWTAGQTCADEDAQYDAQQDTAHAGAEANICGWGNAQDECPDWTNSTAESVIDSCLQMMFDEGPPPAGSCTGTCYSTHGHYINMTGTSYRLGVACGFYTTAGGSIWATQNFE